MSNDRIRIEWIIRGIIKIPYEVGYTNPDGCTHVFNDLGVLELISNRKPEYVETMPGIWYRVDGTRGFAKETVYEHSKV